MAGFASLKFMDADVVYDGGFPGQYGGQCGSVGRAQSWLSGGGAPASHMYFRHRYIFLRPHKDRDMVPSRPGSLLRNQDAMVKLIAWAGNMSLLQPLPAIVITR